MATNFPTSLDSLTNPASSDQLNNPSHSAQHANANDAIEQLQAKVGINGSAITTSHDYKISQLEAAIAAGSSGTKLIYQDIRNQSGSSLSKGTPVRVTGSDGASGKLLVASASNSSESDSSKTFGLTSSTVSNNSNGQVVTNGLLEGIDTTGAVDGDPVWLGVNGAKIYGIANKPVAPAHLVYLGVVVRGGQQNTGSIFVSIQNGFEIQELHNVLINNATLQNKDALVYDSTTQLWKNYNLSLDFVSSSDVQNSLGDYIPLNTLGNAGGPAELDIDGNLLIPENKIIIEGATADAYELTIQAPDVASDITVTLPNAAGTLALTSDISTAIANLVNSAPSTLDTLNELATALGNDANFSTTVTNSIGGKVSKSGGDTITASSASTNGLIIKGATSQTANLQEWQNSSGTVLTSITPSGDLNFGSNLWNIKTTGTNVIQWQPTTGTTFLSYGSSNIPATIQGSASQTGDLTQWKNNSGTILARITSTGVIGTTQNVYAARYYFSNNGTNTGTSISFMDGSAGGGISIRNIDLGTPNAAYDNIVPLTVSGNINQTANLQEWRNNAGTVGTSISSNSTILTTVKLQATSQVASTYEIMAGGINAAGALASRSWAANVITIVARAASSQTANIQEWQNSSGTALFSIDSSGFPTGKVSGFRYNAYNEDSKTLKYLTWWNGTSDQWGIGQINQEVYMGGISSAPNRRIGFYLKTPDNGIGSLTTNADMYIVQTGVGINTPESSINSQLMVTNSTASKIGLVVKAAASQTANLQEWQNSSGTVLAKITSTGAFDATAITVNGSPISGGGLTPFTISSNTALSSNSRYLVDTTAARTLTLPASPSVGDEIQVFDASNLAGTNNVTINSNSGKINGSVQNAIIDVDGAAVSFVYTGSTYGWRIG